MARHNDVLEASRELVSPLERAGRDECSRKETFCYGAGGAHTWMEERAKPINEEPVREAAAIGADTLAVACPFCTVMLDDGVRARARSCGWLTRPRCYRSGASEARSALEAARGVAAGHSPGLSSTRPGIRG